MISDLSGVSHQYCSLFADDTKLRGSTVQREEIYPNLLQWMHGQERLICFSKSQKANALIGGYSRASS